jgi:hypothetical protein
MSMLGGAALSTTNMLYSWSALEMLSKSSTQGYYLPWTRAWDPIKKKYEGKIANFGRKMGMWGDRGVVLGKRPSQYAVKGLRRTMGFGYSSIERTLAQRYARTVGADAAKMVAKRALTFAAGSMVLEAASGIGLALITAQLAGMAGEGISMLWKAGTAPAERHSFLRFAAEFPDTRATATSRQRAVQAITESQLQARSAIGNEAMLFHR